MSCNHGNPPGYLFCGTCGEALDPPRCRCGFAAGAGEKYCGRCGASLAEGRAGKPSGAIDAERRFDIEHLAQQAEQENKYLETTHKARVTQDDIRKMLSVRRKRF